jgi:phage terminase large subunit
MAMNATEAYQAVYPSATRETSRRGGSVLMSKHDIIAEIDRRMSEQVMTSNEVLKRLSDMSKASLLPFIRITNEGFTYFDFSDPDAKNYFHLIKKLKTKRTRRLEGRGDDAEAWEDEWVEVELHDAQSALEKIGKYHKLFTDTPPPTDAEAQPLTLPADAIAPSFINVYRDIRDKRHTEYLFFGGRGSTKSSFVSLVIIYLLVNNPGIHALACRQVGNTLRDSVYSQLQWAIAELGLSDKFKCTTSPLGIEYLPTKQQIYFRGADDPLKIKSIKPPFGYIGILWFEELDSFHGPEQVRSIEQSAIRGGDEAFIFKNFNPPRTSQNWANKYVQIPKTTQFQHKSDYRSVPPEWLGKTFLEEADHLQAVNPAAYDHEYLGIVNGTGGQVFENVIIRKITDAEIAQFDRVTHGLDWGFYPDPAHYSRVHYDAARLTLYIFGEYRTWKTSNKDLYNVLYGTRDDKGKVLTVGLGLTPEDTLICDSAEPKSVADFREYGASARGAEKGPESVKYSMKWLASLKAIVIDNERAPYSAEEFLDYEFERTVDGDLIADYPDKKNHAIDGVRYATNMIWRRRGQ